MAGANEDLGYPDTVLISVLVNGHLGFAWFLFILLLFQSLYSQVNFLKLIFKDFCLVL